MKARTIEAAGGVVWRETSDHQIEVLLVHRPRYDDWSFPKGKLDNGEVALIGALREVLEETGLRCVVGVELPATRYVDRRGRDKRVRYWAMQEIEGEFAPNNEVDKVRWLPLEDVPGKLSYRHDLVVIADLPHALESVVVVSDSVAS